MHLTLVVSFARYREHAVDKGAVRRLLAKDTNRKKERMAVRRKLRATTPTPRFVVRLMVALHPRQLGWQRRALGFLVLAFVGISRPGCELLELLLKRGQVGVHGLIEHGALLGVQALAFDAELHPFELGELEGEFVDFRVAPLDLAGRARVPLDQLLRISSAGENHHET
jgi:hypothetical protein